MCISRLMVKSKTGRAMLSAILSDMERLHSNEHNKNFELGLGEGDRMRKRRPMRLKVCF